MSRTQVRVSRLVIVDNTPQQFLQLQETSGQERSITMVIGGTEAQEIQRILKGDATPRPLTHELMADTLEQFNLAILESVIHDLNQGTFRADLLVAHQDAKQPVKLDCRPSDAIALCLRLDAPIWVTEEVWATSQSQSEES